MRRATGTCSSCSRELVCSTKHWSSTYVGPGWRCDSGAKFDLRSNALRRDCWTSSDAAGLPVLAGLVRYEEAVTAGVIAHALRFTVSKTRASVHRTRPPTTRARRPPRLIRPWGCACA